MATTPILRTPQSDRHTRPASLAAGRAVRSAHDYALRKDLWAFTSDRIAVRFQYESRDASGQWWRSYGNEQWEFDPAGYMRRREASINDVSIREQDRCIFGPRPEPEHGAPRPLA